MKLMTKNKAMELLGIGRNRLEAMLKAGQIKVVPSGDGYLIPEWSLEQCQKNTVDYPTNSSSEVIYTTSKSQPLLADKIITITGDLSLGVMMTALKSVILPKKNNWNGLKNKRNWKDEKI